MSSRDNCPVDSLSAYIDGELTDAERVAVGAHLGSCPACRETVEDLRRLADATADEGVPPVPARLAARISERLDADGKGGEPVEQGAAADTAAENDERATPPVPIATGRKTPRRQPVRRGWIGPPLAAAAALAMAAVVWTAWQSGSGSGLEPDPGPGFIASQPEAPAAGDAQAAPLAAESAGETPARDESTLRAGSDLDADSSRGRRRVASQVPSQAANEQRAAGVAGATAGKGAASSPPPPPPAVFKTAEPEAEGKLEAGKTAPAPEPEPEARLKAKKVPAAGDAVAADSVVPEDEAVAAKVAPEDDAVATGSVASDPVDAPDLTEPVRESKLDGLGQQEGLEDDRENEKNQQKENAALESAAAFADVAGPEEQQAQVLDEMAVESSDRLRSDADAPVARVDAPVSSVSVAPASPRVLAVRTPDGLIELTSAGRLTVTAGDAVCRTLWDGAAVSTQAPGASAGDDESRAPRTLRQEAPAGVAGTEAPALQRAQADAGAFTLQAGDRAPADLQAALAEIFMLAELGTEDQSAPGGKDAVLNAPAPDSAPDPGGAAVAMRRDDGTVVYLEPEADADTARLVTRLREKLAALMSDHYRAGLDDACDAVPQPLP